MKKLTEKEIDKLYYDCVKEKITQDKPMHFIYHAMEVGVPPICCRTLAEWKWSKDFNLLKNAMNYLILWDMVATICGFSNYTNENIGAYELMKIIEETDPEIIKSPRSFKELKDLIFDSFVSTNEIKTENYIFIFDKMTELFNKLGVECTLRYFNSFDKAFSFLEDHQYGGVIPVYEDFNKYFDGDDGSLS